jgi:hypothetical protein
MQAENAAEMANSLDIQTAFAAKEARKPARVNAARLSKLTETLTARLDRFAELHFDLA